MNYSIEGNIDFYNELLKTLCETTVIENTKIDKDEKQNNENIDLSINNENEIENENKQQKYCFISHAELVEPIITLECKHSFNYIPLFTEIKRQKEKDYDSRSLKVNQIKCPYCRQIQNKLLPYLENHSCVSLVKGVTFPQKYSMYCRKCDAVIKSGKRKGEVCGKVCMYPDKKCKIHNKVNNKVNKSQKSSQEKTEKCTCSVILLSGKRKGEPCGKSIFKDNMCKRHYNLAKKKK